MLSCNPAPTHTPTGRPTLAPRPRPSVAEVTALGLFLVSTWELDVAEPWFATHLLVAGFGFGLNNTPILTRAFSSVSGEYRGTVAPLITVSWMVGVASGLGACPTIFEEKPLPGPRESCGDLMRPSWPGGFPSAVRRRF